eukprot:1963921-Amphidinium_carterae.1
MDRRVPVEAEDPEVLAPRMDAAADGPEVVGAVYRVGPHACHLTDGDTRITCKKCGRYVTTYKGTWRNMGTIAKQPCKPKARRQKAETGKHLASKAEVHYRLCHQALGPGEEPLAQTRSLRAKNRGCRQRPRAVPRRLRRVCGPLSKASLPFQRVVGRSPEAPPTTMTGTSAHFAKVFFHVATLRGRAIRDQ